MSYFNNPAFTENLDKNTAIIKFYVISATFPL